MLPSRRRRVLRWLAPLGVVAVAAGGAALPHVLPASADAIPNLPAITPAQLLEKVSAADLSALSGDVELSTHLGLPDLGSLGVSGSGTILDLLSGNQTGHLWMAGPAHVRVEVDAPSAESDWILNGTDAWAWDSRTQRVTHATVTPDTHGTETSSSMNPVDAAQKLLAAIDPSTAVSVRTPGYVAGQPVYELVLSPRSKDSTVSAAVIAVDASTGVPLEVRVEARSSTTPAVDLKFTSISYNMPAASTFAFKPPPGATVSEVNSASSLLPLGSRHGGDRRPVDESQVPVPQAPAQQTPAAGARAVQLIGSNWDTVAIISQTSLNGQLGELMSSAPAVKVGSGTARLLTTTLVNVLFLDDGRIAVGAVTPAALEAAIPAH
jgi:outer membrane lipoprotein-sorting protein